MSLKYMWGFGGVRLTSPDYSPDSNYDCTLPYATGSLAFEPVTQVYTTLNQEQHVIHLGYRVKIHVTAVNSCTTDYTEFAKLINVLNAGTYEGRDIYLYPRYSSTEDNLYYNVRLTSGVNFESVAMTKTAQRIELDFESFDVVTTLPTLTSDPVTYDWVYSEDAGATTDNLVDHDGNELVFSLKG